MNTVALDQKGIRINGQYEILVVSSLFYFRIPRSKWESRMRLLKSAGYNAIDVYFPWNYHEKKPGEWDFTEERDVSAFLRLARENNLWVIARPGPYICSEWDGGGIPAWHYLSVPQSSIPQPRSGSEMGDATCRRAEARGRFQSIPQPRSGSEMEDATCRRAEVRGRFHKDFRIRQNDPAYLEELGRWYGKILPILKPYQWTEQGTVLLLQTENELDYYLCDEPQAYMESLAEMARREGITIPLIACCGQDDIAGSGGNAPGVIPAFNIYADSENTGLEIRTQKLYQRMAQRDCPLLVTETNREHSFLKRLLSCGAKMVSPYNQTAGTTADYYNAITNWGTKEQPAALLASDYDFCSMITPDGMLRADEYVQARLLNALRITCKEALAAAMPPLENTTASLNREAVLECGMRPAAERRRGGVSKASPNRKAVLECGMRPAAERRRGGVSKAQSQCCMVHSAGRFTTGQITGEKGSFFSLTNLEKEEREFLCCLSGENDSFSVRLPAGYTALLPVCLELGEGYKLTGSSYELAYVQFPNPEGQCEAEASNGQFFAEHKSETGDRSCRRAQIALYGFGELTVKLEYKGRIYGLHKSEACEAEQPQRILLQDLEIIYGTPEQIARLDLPGIDPWRLEDANACASASVKRAGVSIPPEPKKMPEQNRLQEMERYGQYRGLGSYEFELEAGQESLLFGLSDIITVYHDGQFQSSFYGDGSARRMSLSKGTWRFDTEIWGHCNFEDIRVPALKMGSLKGIRKILHIVRSEDISCNWELENTGSWMDIDSYNTPASPVTGRYTKEIQLWGDCTDYALTFGCADCAIQVWVNGKKAGDVQSGDRTMDITPFVLSGELCRISLLVTRRYYSDQVGSITLTGGNAQTDCRYQDRTFLGYTGGMEGSLSFPVRLNAGEKLILQPEIPAMGHGDLKLIFHGREMLLTVACGGHIAGRIALNASMLPKVAGGAPNEIFLCGEWLARDGVTVVSPNREAVLEWGMRPAAERKRGGVSILCQALSESAVLEQIEIRYKMNA